MGQKLFSENIEQLVVATTTTLTQAASIINVGGQQYISTSAITLDFGVTGVNGLDTGSIAQNTTYNIFAVPNNGALGLVASASATPTGFTAYKQIGKANTFEFSATLEGTILSSEEVGVTTVMDRETVGTVGANGSAANYGALSSSDFPNTTNLNIFSLAGNANSTFGTGGNLTETGSPVYNGKGFFGRDNVVNLDGVNDFLSSSNAVFDITPNSTSFSYGAWIRAEDWSKPPSTGGRIIAKYSGGSNMDFMIEWNASGTLDFYVGFVAVSLSANEVANLNGWVHLASTSNGSTFNAYVNGQLVASGTPDGNNTSADIQIGAGNSGSFFPGQIQDFFFHTGTELTATEINNIYSKRFNSVQKAAGHTLTADSFSRPVAGNTLFWGLDAATGKTDNSGNGEDLNLLGSPELTSELDLFGAANAYGFDGNQAYSKDFSGTFTKLNQGENTFSIGVWAQALEWKDFSATRTIMAIANSGGSLVFSLRQITGSSNIRMASGPGDTPTDATPTVDFTSGSWHHFVVVCLGNNEFKVYVDGVFSFSHTNIGSEIDGVDVMFGTETTPSISATWNGRLTYGFLTNTALSDNDIHKLYSAKVSHNANISPNNQNISGTEEVEQGIKIPLGDFITDMDSDNMYIDLSGHEPDNKITVKVKK